MKKKVIENKFRIKFNKTRLMSSEVIYYLIYFRITFIYLSIYFIYLFSYNFCSFRP